MTISPKLMKKVLCLFVCLFDCSSRRFEDPSHIRHTHERRRKMKVAILRPGTRELGKTRDNEEDRQKRICNIRPLWYQLTRDIIKKNRSKKKFQIVFFSHFGPRVPIFTEMAQFNGKIRICKFMSTALLQLVQYRSIRFWKENLRCKKKKKFLPIFNT